LIAGGEDVGTKLKTALGNYNVRHEFRPGQLVKWKDGLRNTRRPLYDEPAIIVSVLSDPITDPLLDMFSPYFRTPLDIVLGLVDDDDELVMYHFDSRRFRPY